MLAIELLFDWPQDGPVCAITGRPTPEPIPNLGIFPETFGNFARLKAPKAEAVDGRIWSIWTDKVAQTTSWIVIGKTWEKRINRPRMRAVLSNPPSEPWGMFVAKDMKTKGLIFAQANLPNEPSSVAFGSSICDVKTTADIYSRLLPLFESGFSKTAIEEVSIPNGKIVNLYFQHMDWMKKNRHRPEYKLATWLLPTQDELKEKLAE
jgi:hypothetical protein